MGEHAKRKEVDVFSIEEIDLKSAAPSDLNVIHRLKICLTKLFRQKPSSILKTATKFNYKGELLHI